jgi:hypothetical protein
MDQARDRAATACEILASGHLEVAVSTAYYAMLYAARAALSERDEYARTHGGTWHLFHERYVTTGAFDQDLHSLAGAPSAPARAVTTKRSRPAVRTRRRSSLEPSTSSPSSTCWTRRRRRAGAQPESRPAAGPRAS